MPAHPLLDIHPAVATALVAGEPVVALESTIISHGMPWPQNAQTALAVEADVRAAGAVPATIAVLDGRLCVGLSPAQIEQLGRLGMAAAKASRRDLALLVARRGNGATTVAATMLIAALAGIRVFATGGIGGVHRGAVGGQAPSLDISADLQELTRTPVLGVCAGVKAILDIGLTLEYLETQGVPVLGYGCDRLPAFFSTDSGFGVDARLDSPAEVATLMQAHWALGLGSGLLLAQPLPAALALPPEQVQAAITQALREAHDQAISGKAVTPFLLQRVNALTGGQSLASNIALIRHNARLAAAVARADAQASQSGLRTPSSSKP